MVVKAKIQEYDLRPVEEEDSINEDEESKAEFVAVARASKPSNFQADELKNVLAAEQVNFQSI